MHYLKAAKEATSVLGGHIEISFNCSGDLHIGQYYTTFSYLKG